MLGVSNTACGGAERFFADFFKECSAADYARHELFFFTDPGTFDVLQSLGKLPDTSRVVVLKNLSNRFKRLMENFNFQRKLRKHRIDIIHVTNYGRNYFDRLEYVAHKSRRPKIVVNIVDCEIPYVINDTTSPRNEGYRKRYLPLFRQIKPDAVFTWYELFCRFALEKGWMPEGALLESARTRFADTKGFMPAEQKQNHIVWAARLTPQKQPLMFLEAVRIVHAAKPELLTNWRVFIYGSGQLEEEVKKFMSDHALSEVIRYNPAVDLRPVLAVSKCFVSTQDYENFPSLSMNEAMAAGNVIVSRNVGQTGLFVEHGKNGYLAPMDNAEGIAAALIDFLSAPEQHQSLMEHSIYLAREVHTPANFIRQIDTFWDRVSERRSV